VKALAKVTQFAIRLSLVSIFLPVSEQPNAEESLTEVKDEQVTVSPKTVNTPKGLLITIEVNKKIINGVFYAEQFPNGRIVLAEKAWAASNLNAAGFKFAMRFGLFGYNIGSLKGVNYELDIDSHVIKINAPIQSFGTTVITNKVDVGDPIDKSPLGVYINYDLAATSTNGKQSRDSYSGFLEAVVFNHYGSLVSNVFYRGSSSITDDQSNIVRAETYFQKDMPSRMQKLIIGDSLSGAGSWSRPVRFGGITWSSDFGLNSGFISAAAPSIYGSAALPSTVDVFIDNQKRQSNSVNPGPFQIDNFSTMSGTGLINLVVKDILGVERLSTQRFYSTPRILRKNLNEFSFEAGMERTNYGSKSNSYENPFVAGTFARGFDGFTLEGRTEIQASRQAAGFNIASLIKNYAVIHLALAASKAEDKKGLRSIFGIEHSSKKVNFNLQIEHYDRDFVQMGASINEINPRQKKLMIFGLNIYNNIWLNTSVISQTNWNSDKFNLVSTSVTIPLTRNACLNTFVSKRLDRNQSYTIGLNVVVPFNTSRRLVMNSTQDTQAKIYNNVQLNHDIVNSNGIGYRVMVNDSKAQEVFASVSADSPMNKSTLDLDKLKSGTSWRFRTSGSVGLFAGRPFASKKIGHGSFAVVKVADQPNVDIYQSNRKVARTNSSGLAFLPNLLPYQKNKISIKPEDLPFHLDVNETSQLITPQARSGVFINLDIHKANNRLVKVLTAGGTIMPIGSKVHMMPSNTDFFIGKRGEVYLTGLSNKNTMLVSWQDDTCSAEISAPIDNTEINSILIVDCK
jgi:outer membrane usher protein